MSRTNLALSKALIQAAGFDPAHQPAESSKTETSRPFSIAISRETGTRGPAVARAVGERLGWPVYDRELLELVARDLHVRVKLLEEFDERHVTWLQECVEAFAAVPGVREGKYVHHLIETMQALAARGRSVIVGRGSPFVLPSTTTLRVRLIAPIEDRIEVVCRERRLERAEAARYVHATDRARAHFIRLHFQYDASDPKYFDMILNTAQLAVDKCANLIVEALEAKSHEYVTPTATFHRAAFVPSSST